MASVSGYNLSCHYGLLMESADKETPTSRDNNSSGVHVALPMGNR